jgi:hypothetical protein
MSPLRGSRRDKIAALPDSPVSAKPDAPLRVVWLLPLLTAVYAVWAGRDSNWDLLNYHYYNVFAWLNGRQEMDLALGQLQTLFNPLLHLPLYFGMEYLDARVYAALLGATQGLNLILIWSIAKTAWPANESLPRYGPVLVALTAGCGAGFLSQLGTSFGDTLLTIPMLGALRLIIANRRSTWLVLLAGVLGGVACGLKPVAGIYAIALAAALAIMPATLRVRSGRLALLAAGGLIGFAASAGWWCWRVWQWTGNPFFPYYNDLFESPLYWDERYVFSFFLPKTLLEAVMYPWLWLANPTRVSEMRFINLAIPGLLTLVVVLGIARLLGLRAQGPTTNNPSVRALFVFWFVGYVLWLTQSSVYRFAVGLEMLAPLLVVVLLVRWVPPDLLRVRVVAVLIVLMIVNRPANFGRFDYASRTMAMTPIQVPKETMMAVAGWAPLSYVVPAFPDGIPFVRIQSNMHGFTERSNGLDVESQRRVKNHRGPVRLLLAEGEWNIAQPMLDHYGYRVDRAQCQMVDATIHGGGGIGRLEMCPLLPP